MSREKIIIGILALLLVMGVLLRFTGFFPGMEKVTPAPENVISEQTGDEDAEEKFLTVHVVGYVANPGIYKLPAEARVHDALDKAGGPVDANLEGINLARPLYDGEQVYIPGINDQEDAGAGGISSGKININRASLSELATLNGIGDKRAQYIIDYREENGPFSRIEDIMNVPLIGTGIFEGIKNHITVY